MHELAFLPALRSYIVRHASGPRCSDRLKAAGLPDAATQFNKLISRIDPTGTQFHAITAVEATPVRDDGTFPVPVKPAASDGSLLSLEQAYDATENHGPWFQELQARLPHLDFERAFHSRNPVIGVYAQLQKLLSAS
jgi:hypothetical protein